MHNLKIESKSMYERAKEAILQYIEQHKGNIEKLPSEADLAKMMGVSRNTVREAIRILERENVLYSRHGVGTFVVNPGKHLTTTISVLESATKIIMDHGYTPSTLDRYIDVRKADERIANLLGIEKGDKILYIERVRAADGMPVVYIEDYISYIDGIDAMKLEYERTKPESLLSFLETYPNMEIEYVVCGIKAVFSDKRVEKKLQLKSQKALILLEQTHYSVKGQPILYSDSYFLSDKFEFNVVRKRK